MKGTNLRSLVLIAVGVFALATALLPANHVAGQDQIEYGEVYDCGSGKRKFRIVTCEGNEDFDWCKVQTLNKFAANGVGSEDKMYRKTIKSAIAEGCKIKGRSAQANNESAPNKTATNTKNRKETEGPAKTWKFKPGDRVMASPGMMNEDKYYQPCTVTRRTVYESCYSCANDRIGEWTCSGTA